MPYIHGGSAAEVTRLTRLNDLINTACFAAVRPRPGDRILDVGSGLGQFTGLLRQAAGPEGRVLAIEGDRAQLERARQIAGETIEWRHGDARRLPLNQDEIGTFDLAHARFILEHVDKPEDVVKGMAAALKPGGRAVLLDDDHELLRLYPALPQVERVWDAYQRTYSAESKDPRIGRRLPSLLADAGLRPQRTDCVFFGGCRGEDRFEPLVHNMAEILRGAAHAIAAQGVPPAETADALDALEAWSRQEGAVLWYVICVAEGVKV